MNSKVSIVTPTFNRVDFLRPLIDSIRNQTYPNWELIIVDDGSTDGTEEFVRNEIEACDQIRYCKRSRSPKGAATCRNIGIEKAEGEYLVFLDSDDLLASFALEQRVAHMERHPDLDFSVFPGLRFNEVPGDDDWLVNSIPDEGTTALDAFFKRENPWQTSAPLWKREFLLNRRLFWNERLNIFQDIDFHIRVLSLDPDFDMNQDSKPDYFWRQNSGEQISSHKSFPKYFDSCNLFLEKLPDYIDRSGAVGREMKSEYLTGYHFFIARILSTQKQLRKSLDIWTSGYRKGYYSFKRYISGAALFIFFFCFYLPGFEKNSKIKKMIRSLYYRLVPQNLDKSTQQRVYHNKIDT